MWRKKNVIWFCITRGIVHLAECHELNTTQVLLKKLRMTKSNGERRSFHFLMVQMVIGIREGPAKCSHRRKPRLWVGLLRGHISPIRFFWVRSRWTYMRVYYYKMCLRNSYCMVKNFLLKDNVTLRQELLYNYWLSASWYFFCLVLIADFFWTKWHYWEMFMTKPFCVCSLSVKNVRNIFNIL